MLPVIVHDLRYALRGLFRAPGFAAAAILTLALGIGAATSIFSVADATLFRPLPYPGSSRLVMVWDQLLKIGVDRFPLQTHTFEVYRNQDHIFDDAGVFWPADRTLTSPHCRAHKPPRRKCRTHSLRSPSKPSRPTLSY